LLAVEKWWNEMRWQVNMRQVVDGRLLLVAVAVAAAEKASRKRPQWIDAETAGAES
jgi:hypothetical protein